MFLDPSAKPADKDLSQCVVNPETGFLENLSIATAFNSDRKVQFLRLYKANSLAVYETCDMMGLSHHTLNTHYKADPVFKQAVDDLRERYTDELEAVSRRNALEPKMVIERIFQLKSLKPQTYADQKLISGPNIVFNIDARLLSKELDRVKAIDAQVVYETAEVNLKNSAPLLESQQPQYPQLHQST